LESVVSSAPCPGLTSVPFSTFHFAVAAGSLGVHPVRSFPLNNCVGVSHFGALFRFRDGALSPVHCHGVPSGPVVVPTSVFPDSLPSKTMSSFLSSSSLGETNVTVPFEISIFGSGRAFPQRLTKRALSCPFSWVISNHEGYSRSGVFRVKSHRPRKGCADVAVSAAFFGSEYPSVENIRINVASASIFPRTPNSDSLDAAPLRFVMNCSSAGIVTAMPFVQRQRSACGECRPLCRKSAPRITVANTGC
jgi:hypothetical protein